MVTRRPELHRSEGYFNISAVKLHGVDPSLLSGLDILQHWDTEIPAVPLDELALDPDKVRSTAAGSLQSQGAAETGSDEGLVVYDVGDDKG